MRRIARTNFKSMQRSQKTEKIFLAPSIADVKLKNSKPASNCDPFIVDWQMEDLLKNSKRKIQFSY